MSTDSRIKFIDIARGIAILCIILGHLGIPQINQIVFTFHVPIFFFITGYFTHSNTPWKIFLKKRVCTLIIPYVCTCLTIILLSVVINEGFRDGNGTRQIALEWIYGSLYGAGDSYSSPFYIKGIGAIWFLLASFWGSLLLRWILSLKKGHRITAVIFLFFAGSWSRRLFWFPLSIQAGCCALLFMYIGHLLHDMIPVLKQLSSEVKVALTLLAFAVWVYFIKDFQSFWLVHCDIGRGPIDILGCICGCYIIMLLSRFIEQQFSVFSKILSYLGKYSIFILCAHLVELNLFPWETLMQLLQEQHWSAISCLYLQVAGKFLWSITITVICTHWNLTRQLFGFPKLSGRNSS